MSSQVEQYSELASRLRGKTDMELELLLTGLYVKMNKLASVENYQGLQEAYLVKQVIVRLIDEQECREYDYRDFSW